MKLNYTTTFLTFAILLSINANSQKLSKSEKKRKKIELKSLTENITDTEISYEDLKNFDQINFIDNKSNEYTNDIKLIHKYELHKFMPFYEIYNKGKKFFIYKEGLGKSYPNEKNIDEHIQLKQIKNIYSFNKENEEKFILFEYSSLKKNNEIEYSVIPLEAYNNRMNFLRKQIKLLNIIQKEDFNISFNSYYKTTESCHNYVSEKKDFIIVSSENDDQKLAETTFKSFNDNGYKKVSKFKSKAFNIDMDYFYVNFELDSIKYYSLDVIGLLNSGILKDSIRSYGKRKYQTESLKRFYDLKELICKNNVDNEKLIDIYNKEEIEKMSKIEFWDEMIPKVENLEKYLSVNYITIPMSINALEYEQNNTIDSVEFSLSMYKIDNHRSNNGYRQGVMTKCRNNYCWYCKYDINISCALNTDGKQYNKNKYLYSSINPENIRDQLISSLTQMFCEKSGLINSNNLQKEKEEKYKKELSEKYGEKYTEAALNGEIIIGMPEDLLTIPLRAWNIDSSSEWGRGYFIYCKFKFDTSKRLRITITDGKVSNLSSW